MVQKNQESIDLRYVRIKDVVFWDRNPKKHDLGKLIDSFMQHGFKNPSIYDKTLGGLVAGNGRAEALQLMQKEAMKPPRGIKVDEDGEWCMPIIFGVDAQSRLDAERYAIDDNNLTMLGGDFMMFDIAKMWTGNEYKDVLQTMMEAGKPPVSMDLDDIAMIINAVNSSNQYAGNDEGHNGVEGGSGEGSGLENDLGDASGRTPGVITIEFNSSFDNEVYQVIQRLVKKNPDWEAEIS